MRVSDLFPSKFVSAADLKGRPATVTIERLRLEEIGPQRDTKPVLYFREAKKGLVANQTNCETIARIAGTDETESWRGVRVELYPAMTEFRGQQVPCIRVRAPGGRPAPATPPREPAAPAPAALEEDVDGATGPFQPEELADGVPF